MCCVQRNITQIWLDFTQTSPGESLCDSLSPSSACSLAVKTSTRCLGWANSEATWLKADTRASHIRERKSCALTSAAVGSNLENVWIPCPPLDFRGLFSAPRILSKCDGLVARALCSCCQLSGLTTERPAESEGVSETAGGRGQLSHGGLTVVGMFCFFGFRFSYFFGFCFFVGCQNTRSFATTPRVGKGLLILGEPRFGRFSREKKQKEHRGHPFFGARPRERWSSAGRGVTTPSWRSTRAAARAPARRWREASSRWRKWPWRRSTPRSSIFCCSALTQRPKKHPRPRN